MKRDAKRAADDRAGEGGSSRPRRTRKAGTPGRSTSSSTTGPPTTPENDGSKTDEPDRTHLHRRRDPESGRFEPFLPFDEAAREAVLAELARGYPPSAACQRVGVSKKAFDEAAADDVDFAAALDAVRDDLDDKVESALFRAAMEGKVTAQTTWLRRRLAARDEADAGETDEIVRSLEDLSDEELVALARSYGLTLPGTAE